MIPAQTPTLQQFLHEIAREDLPLPLDKVVEETWKQQLTDHIQHLINHDFQKLISLLYRVDIEEAELRKRLALHPEIPAAELITDQIISRIGEKIKAREQFTSDPGDIPAEDRW